MVTFSTPANGAFEAGVHVGPLVIVNASETTGAIKIPAPIGTNSRARPAPARHDRAHSKSSHPAEYRV